MKFKDYLREKEDSQRDRKKAAKIAGDLQVAINKWQYAKDDKNKKKDSDENIEEYKKSAIKLLNKLEKMDVEAISPFGVHKRQRFDLEKDAIVKDFKKKLGVR